ncbi:hypothetical protein AAEU33_17300 [Chryseobacterium sp. Chry.R1]|uniref:hypothetical protein n=1 Tax=Chryseobacterium sp. Chry.R1 TaxID=3139392 RepID=UPI0031F789C8
MKDPKDLVTAVSDLRDCGYNYEFSIKDKQLFSDDLSMTFEMDEFIIDKAYSFNEYQEPINERLFAITLTKEKTKGYLVDAYGAIEAADSNEIHIKFNVMNINHVHPIDDEETKYGLPRVKKALFNEEPDRYTFRMGFPDFPPCPFGNKFEALGWDKEDKHYVWLASSIIKDNRLVRELYKK